VSIFLLLLVVGGLLPLILASLEIEHWPTVTEMRWTMLFLLVLLKRKFSQNLNEWLKPTKRAKTMKLTSIPEDEWHRMPIIQRYQHFMRRKFQEMENVYYPFVDELSQKLDDLGEISPDHIPEFVLHTFAFIKEWQYGEVSSEYVLNLLKGMNAESVAEKTICRRLRNFMHGKEKLDSYHYIKAVHDQLQVKCVPLYLKFLQLQTRYFEKMVEIDKKQVQLMWIEQTFSKNGDISNHAREISLNQMYREIDSNIIMNNDYKYVVGENMIVFDESLKNDDLACHWIFGPKNYISMLKNSFKVTEIMNIGDEKEYIQRLIKAHIS
jgi:hypothetical protein